MNFITIKYTLHNDLILSILTFVIYKTLITLPTTFSITCTM